FDGFAAAIGFAALVIVYLLAQRGEDLREPAWVASRRLLHLGFGFLVRILEGFSAVRDPGRALLILLISFALWIVQTGTYAIPFLALHVPLGWKEGALTTQVLALTAIIPAGPGFAGSFEIATQNLLSLFGVDRTLATSYLEYTRIAALLAVFLYAAGSVVILKLTQPASAKQVAPANAVR
ncbi:MAG TPA: lysylphosphatidylglycerol synthase domain-containing protein, partial [Chloroflexota bacterium]